MKEVQDELSKPGFNSFGLGDCKAPKVLGDIVESIAGAIFLDSGRDTAVVWKVSCIISVMDLAAVTTLFFTLSWTPTVCKKIDILY